MKRRWLVGMGSVALMCAQLVTTSCGDGSSIVAGGDADASVDVAVDVLFPDVPVDTVALDTEVPDTALPDTEVPDTVLPDTTLPDTALPDTAEPDTQITDAADATDTTDTTTPPAYVDWCRLQWPLDVTVGAATPIDVYGHVFVTGLTSLTTGNDTHADLKGRVGFGASGSDPATWTAWYDATPNAAWNGATAGEPNNDEYRATLPAFATVGARDFAFAFSYDGGQHWTYCDRNAGAAKDGSADGYHADDAGHVTVVANPCATNPCTSPPSACDEVGKLHLYASPGACSDNAGQAACDYGAATVTDCVATGKFCDAQTLTCVDDACNPNPCTTTPDPSCDGTFKVTFTAPGSCDDTTGTGVCTYAEAARVDCTTTLGFCVRGDCRAWRLAGVGDLRITEVMANPEKVNDSVGEWFEVENLADVPVNLWGLVVEDDGSDEFTVGTDVIVPVGGFAVLGKSDVLANNGGVTVNYVYNIMALANTGADTLRLLRGADVVDEFTWGAGVSVVAARSLGLDPDATDNDLTNWCAAQTAYNDVDFGTPGAPNDACRLTGLWCRLQWPLETTTLAGVPLDVFGRVYVAGVTDATAGVDANPLLVGAAGYGTAGSAPETWTHWTAAAGNATATGVEANNDEYVATLTTPAVGAYSFAFRFSGDGGNTWVYCDKNAGAGADGSQDGYSVNDAGALTVVTSPCTPNPCTTPPSGCSGTTLTTYASPGACTVNGVSAACNYGAATVVNCADTTKVCDPATLSCIVDPCTPNPCTTAPAPTCDGNTLVTYVAAGTCSGAALCTHAEAGRQDCGAQFCTAGACHDWRLVGQAGDLLITELIPNPAVVSDANGEWFEVRNEAGVQLNLRGLIIASNNANETSTVNVDLLVDAGDYVVFGKSTDVAVNGGAPVDFALVTTFNLGNSSDVVTLTVGATVIDALQYGTDGIPMSIASGVALQLHAGATDNANARDWCAATASYSPDNLATPGAANGICYLGIGWCRLQYPDAATLAPTAAFDAYGRYYVAGLTDVTTTGNDASALVRGAFALSVPPVDGADPKNDPATWTWTAAALNAAYGVASPGFEANNDEWTAALAAPATPGAYLLGFRVSGDAGQTWTYCDLDKRATGGADGAADGFAIADVGHVTVTDPCSPNPCTTPPNVCAGETLSTFAATGTCTVAGTGNTCDYGTATTVVCTATGQRCNPTAPACVDCLGNADCALPFETCELTGHTCQDACVDDAFESNDSIATAHVLATDTLATDLVLCATNGDFYSATLAVGQTLDVLVEYALVGAATGLDLKVYGPTGTEVATDTAATATGSLLATTTVGAGGAGVYTVGLEGAAGVQGTYDLTVLFSNDPCAINPCTVQQPATCSGDDLVTPNVPGVCADNGAGGTTCSYTATTTTTCADFCNAGACTDWRYPDAFGELVITEVFPGAGATAWFEVYNATADPLNLEDLEVFDLGTPADTFTVSGDVIVAPGDYFVFGASNVLADNGGVTVDYVWPATGFTLDLAADELALSYLGILDTDDIGWDNTWPVAADKALNLDPIIVATNAGAATTNDLAANWCLATAGFGGGATLGTPGAANSACLTNWTVGWCRLQWPIALTDLAPGTVNTVYGHLYIDGLTTLTDGVDTAAQVIGAVGYGPDGSDPATWTAWTAATPNGDWSASAASEVNNDEYQAILTAPAAAGPYDFAYRFSGDGGQTWMYCDRDRRADGGADGSADGYNAADAGEMTVAAPAAPTLFFSEYIEGSAGTNKMLEIFNHGASAIDLTGCSVQLFTNGSPTVSQTAALTGTLAAHDTLVMCSTAQTVVAAGICDTSNSTVTNFNGDDAVALVCNDQFVDIIGRIGQDPGTAWGTGSVTTADRVLRRNCGITQGDTTPGDDFDPATEWTAVTYAATTADDGLGSYRPVPNSVSGGNVAGGKPFVIEAVDLVRKKVVLRNVSAASATVGAGWYMCNFPYYETFTATDVVVAAGASATFDIPVNLAVSTVVPFELGVYTVGTDFGNAANMVAYVEVGGAGLTRESVAVTAGVWTAGSFVTVTSPQVGFALNEAATATAATAYGVFGPFCGIY